MLRILRSIVTGSNTFLHANSFGVPHHSKFRVVTTKLGEDVRILVHQSAIGTYAKPIQPHCKDQFERFFGFESNNFGFTKDRVVFVPNGNFINERIDFQVVGKSDLIAIPRWPYYSR
jgi:hypothetical protein